MKTQLLICAALICAGFSVSAQELKNTRWEGTPPIPEPTPVVMEFRNHTVNVLYQGEPIEYMWYMQEGNKLKMGKYWGGSPCKSDAMEQGEYQIIFKENTISLKAVSDKCPQRKGSLEGVVFTQVK